ncbi:radical SAM protein [bacterium]|nr:MAG: radical SAM protein [bacterium]
MFVSEIFLSIQGESTYAGLACVFVRLAGCNLTCSWCDTPYARGVEGARDMTADEIIAEVKGFKCGLVEVTGGEPLIQSGAKELVEKLVAGGLKVLIETNGSVCLDGISKKAVKVVDVKCPSSGHAGSFLIENLGFITEYDEFKFVIAAREDYEFAKDFLREFAKDRAAEVLFAPVTPGLDPKDLARWILEDGLSVRLSIQLHKYIWNGERGR